MPFFFVGAAFSRENRTGIAEDVNFLNKFWGTKAKSRSRGCAPARRLTFCSSATKSQQKQSLPCGRHDELGGFIAGRLLVASQQPTLLARHENQRPRLAALTRAKR